MEGTPLSLANLEPGQTELEFVIRCKNNQPALEQLLDKINKEQPLEIEGPFGQSILKEHTQNHTLFVSGGTGFSQIGPLVQQWLNQNPTKKATLYCGLQNLNDYYFKKTIEQWQHHHNLKHHLILSNDHQWQGRQGLVHHALLEDFPSLEQCFIYMSGPWNMVQQAAKDFNEHQLPSEYLICDLLSEQ